ncbi:hypothetical protein CDL15_Pgr026940 [Punica granatum]|uniref:F-box domain-containing protein n=1 Tax=Punica granatum TaxID=22663 RepID=A0A218XY90_PUNGR|nr:hypothetical protein CDL15_Pgr026940 [Punica granatum]PKI33934.1 hypothetical protein CRG98_045681 [Punica granatum]
MRNLFSSLCLYPKGLLSKSQANETLKDSKGETNITSLPRDVLIKILLLLPVESLVQLKDVCHYMHRVITSQYFTRLHLKRSRSQSGLICNTLPNHRINPISKYISGERYHASFISFDFNDQVTKVNSHGLGLEHCLRALVSKYHIWKYKMDVRVRDSCDGLLLLEITGDCDLFERTPLLICNPVTRSYQLLPAPGELAMNYFYGKIVYDSSKRKYKIIGFILKLAAAARCFILELPAKPKGELTSWKEISIPAFPLSGLREFGASVSVKGKLYCLMRQYNREAKQMEQGLLSFDVVTEEVTYTCPILRPLSVWDFEFSSSKKLYQTYCQEGKIEVWVLEDFDSLVWSKHHIIETTCRDDFCTLYMEAHMMRPMVLLDGDDKLIVKHKGDMCVYLKSSKEWEGLAVDFKRFAPFRHWSMAHYEYYVPHVNSLISWNNLEVN